MKSSLIVLVLLCYYGNKLQAEVHLYQEDEQHYINMHNPVVRSQGPNYWNQSPGFAVPYRLMVDTIPKREGGKEAVAAYSKFLSRSLDVVAMFPPKGDQFFSWKGDKPKNKFLRVNVVGEDHPIIRQMNQFNVGGLGKDARAFTYVHKTGKDTIIDLFVIRDKFETKNGEPTDESEIKLLGTLAHELYGNVQHFLKNDPNPKTDNDFKNRRVRELNAFTAGIEFTNRIMKSPQYAKFPIATKRLFEAELKKHKEYRDSWKRSGDD